MNNTTTASPGRTPISVSRWLPAAVPVIGAIALVASAAQLWAGFVSSRTELVLGQASAVVTSIEDELHAQNIERGELPEAERLARLYAAIEPFGATEFAFFGRDGSVLFATTNEISALRPAASEQLLNGFRGRQVGYVTPLDRTRRTVGTSTQQGEPNTTTQIALPAVEGMQLPPQHFRAPQPPGYRPHDGPPPPAVDTRQTASDPAPRPSPGARRPPPPMPIAVAFTPLVDQAIGRTVRISLAINAAGAVLLLVLAVWVFRQLGRRDALLAARASERNLASLGAMSATLAHEIRNPLASLKGHAQLLREAAPNGSPQWEKSNHIVHESQRLEALVRSLLAFVKSGQSQRADTALLPILRAAIGSTALEQGTVLLDESGVPERWQLDPAQIERVLHNLVDNALQAAPPNTPVLVAARVQADRLWISVHDSGPGIDPAIADRLFEPFVTTRLHGTGLGLAIAREMVRAHGGELDVIAPAEGGTSFRFWIPRGRG